MQLNNNIGNQRYGRSIKKVVAALKFQGFAPSSLQRAEEEKALEIELFRQVKNIATDSAATGTHFFNVPTIHRFNDGAQMQLSLNFLYNKEAATLDVHSVLAGLGEIQERLIPDEQKILPEPTIIRSLLEHKAATRR
jgi:hypothetical protein